MLIIDIFFKSEESTWRWCSKSCSADIISKYVRPAVLSKKWDKSIKWYEMQKFSGLFNQKNGWMECRCVIYPFQRDQRLSASWLLNWGLPWNHSPTGPGGHQNDRGWVFPIILARQEPQRYKNEILVVEGQVIPQMKALSE